MVWEAVVVGQHYYIHIYLMDTECFIHQRHIRMRMMMRTTPFPLLMKGSGDLEIGVVYIMPHYLCLLQQPHIYLMDMGCFHMQLQHHRQRQRHPYPTNLQLSREVKRCDEAAT
jgi:hypothetical protein